MRLMQHKMYSLYGVSVSTMHTKHTTILATWTDACAESGKARLGHPKLSHGISFCAVASDALLVKMMRAGALSCNLSIRSMVR